MRAICVVFAVLLAGCAAQPVLPADPAPLFPARVAGFERVDEPERGRASFTAGYQMFAQGEPIMLTVQLRPPHEAAGPDAGAAELRRSVAEVRRFYPEATADPPRPAFLTRDGGLRQGAATTVRYRDIMAGKEQEVALDIAILCCDRRGLLYEYRTRHPASLPAAEATAAFMQQLAWGGDAK